MLTNFAISVALADSPIKLHTTLTLYNNAKVAVFAFFGYQSVGGKPCDGAANSVTVKSVTGSNDKCAAYAS